jgi:hypothetical protein
MEIVGIVELNVVKLSNKFTVDKICTELISSSLKTDNDYDDDDSSIELLAAAVALVSRNKQEQKWHI